MKLPSSLYFQTIAMLSLYLALVCALAFFSFNAKFGIGLETIVNSPLGDRLDTIAEAIAAQLRSTPRLEWDQILKHFGKAYGATFYLFSPWQEQIAGQPVTLPKEVAERLMMPPPFSPHPVRIGFFGFGRKPFDGPSPPPIAIETQSLPPDFHPGFPKDLPPHLREPPGMEVFFRTGPAPDSPSGMSVLAHDDRPFQNPHFHHFNEKGPLPLIHPFGMHTAISQPHGRFVVRSEKPNLVWLGTYILIADPNAQVPHMPAIVLASCEHIWETGLLFDFGFVAIVLGCILFFTFLFWYPFIHRITHALAGLTKVTERIAEGHFDARLRIKSRDEIGRLSEAVNSMAARLESFVFGQKRFLGAISHELRTPIARLQMALELLEGTSSEEQKAHIEDIREEVEEMKNLVDELLAFSKAGLRGKTPSLESVDLKQIFSEIIPNLSARQSVNCQIEDGINVVADPLLLERSLSNILRNSVRYGGDEEPISIKAGRSGSEVTILIKDGGPGVPEDSLEHLGEPFYRPEESRTRASGGVGLGLAIVKSCVEACHGAVSFRNGATGGFEVELRLKSA
jgi:two-component system, OmpR family, sensor histidine kinase CpxA